MGLSRRCQNWSEKKRSRPRRIRGLWKQNLWRMGVGVGGGLWFIFKWSTEIKCSSVPTGSRGPWQPLAGEDQSGSGTASCLRSAASLPSSLGRAGLLTLQRLPVGINDTNEWPVFFSLLVYKLFIWWMPAGPIPSLDWKYPLGPPVISSHCSSHLFLSLPSDLQTPKLAFHSSAMAP